MNDTFSASCAAIANEPIPGYVLETRLGRGGYGQVWKALAPGSLYKAVKIVHGYHNDELAMRELQALERIKQVRHPFLLSIERIEISDGQLVIVTELAEMSLRDQFDEHRLCGEPGIPRPELLRHLGDVADALDFISQRHGLQHLDIKPENLLVVGDRLKVGDFGLVNDLQQVNSSLMSTLTPVYAPPELFNGRPHLHSDQYSLAIVYQEMLTGQRPFDGTTAAQLASQHLMDPPNLSSLPTSDREVLARALAKNPELRFESCRQLIDQLLDVNVPDEIASDNCLGNGGAGVEFADVSTLVEAPHIYSSVDVPAAMAAGASATTPARAAPVADLPRLETAPRDVCWRPTLVVGLGGTGGRALRRFRRQLADRFGDTASLGAFRLLYVDTDLKSVVHASTGDEPSVLAHQETLSMPLRRTQDYGGDKNKFLRWLSRRWLYNIPRSLKTEGRRPLGRVALVDHVDELLERLRGAIREMTDTETLTTSGETVGGQFERTSPRVFIVASAAGGTGGGMVVDVAYAVRQVLREQALEDGGVHGLLTFSTPRDPEARQLATANAIATLLEINHLSHRDTEYPGADECELAAAKTGDPSFSSLSFLHL
ncbi:MAG: protein kinase, partial [Planctomycetales bacterium]|nr:protein kinase [Planctomycetales bacterium]